ncbi:hypothetical protein [Mycolicibacterium parafortuitum]|uniref:Transmembrane protein n=1 Tax=Mycolicibacterium parafortuitum TaxID=39692 RepID=A0A375YFP6_MYCPF|nr:hypothetical protein [Mycolicibacterium parafortuitum]ORB31328.1 hypothetical protein BST38_04845 [Mycolicibacterium parafortuitum]SRX79935.1 hypothetical protein MPP7335_01673 [Mycolicibacterium parafortuitum]
MTGTEDSNSSTRPISVAELLARNGTIGAPPVGGRRRRRRGNADAVTVAELTGEIPIIRPDDPPPTAPVAEPTPAAETPSEPDDEPSTNGVVDHTDTAAQDDVQAEPEAEPDAVDDVADAEPEEEAEQAESAGSDGEVQADPEVQSDPEAAEDEADTVEAEAVAEVPEPDTVAEPVVEQSSPPPAPKRRFGFPRFGRKSAPVAEPVVERAAAPAQAEVTDVVPTVDEARDQTALDDAPADIEVEDIDVEAAVDADTATDTADTDIADYIDDIDDDDLAEDLDKDDLSKDDDSDKDDEDDLPSYLRPSKEPRLFGGPSAADRELVDTIEDDLADEDLAEDDLDDDLDVEDEPRKMSSVVHAAWIVGQCVIAVFFGAGLFVAFDQLWKWNNIIALVLSVLVILGLVVGVRIVRKTEDIGSTLIAVAVGALVTLGPLALLQSG